MYHFYILRCSDDTLYCGMTNDLAKRIKEHNGSKKSAKYTSGRRPVKLVYHENFPTIQEALKRESEVKKWTKSKKEVLVSSYSNVL